MLSPNAWAAMLPAPDLPVSQLLSFILPPFGFTSFPLNDPQKLYLLPEEPDTDALGEIDTLPVPPIELIKVLKARLKSQKSLRHPLLLTSARGYPRNVDEVKRAGTSP